MFWIVFGVVFVIWNVFGAIDQGFLMTREWISGAAIGAWTAIVVYESAIWARRRFAARSAE